MFSLLLCGADPKSRSFWFPLLCQWGGEEEAGRDSQDSWPEPGQRDISYHGMPCLVYKWRGKVGQEGLTTAGELAGERSAGAEHLCTTCLSWVFFFSLFVISTVNITVFHFLPLLNSSYLPISTHLVYLISVLPSIPLQGEWAEDKDWLKDSYCHLGLNSSPGGK